MSAYYLRQVVREWSLLTIYKGMFEFMMLQVVAITLVIIFPSIAIWFPQVLQEEARGIKTEQVDDSANRLEEDPLKGLETGDSLEEDQSGGQEQQEEEGAGDSLEKDELSNTKK
jgi:hypothetical protein